MFSLYLSKNKRSITKSVNESEYNWLVQNANILIQSAEASIRHTEIAFRDKCMAENVAWILNDKPKEKIILWAHIGHTRKELPWMGCIHYPKNMVQIITALGPYQIVELIPREHLHCQILLSKAKQVPLNTLFIN